MCSSITSGMRLVKPLSLLPPSHLGPAHSSHRCVDCRKRYQSMDPKFLRTEAERCHRLAEGSKEPEAATRWSAMSRDYHALADELEAAKPPTTVRTSTQHQPVQQQQSKREPED